MNIAAWVGGFAAAASIASFAPQAWKIIRARHTEGLSPATYALTCIGFSLWIGYGVLMGQWAVIVPNAVCLLLAGFILAMILMPRHRAEKVAEVLDVTSES